MVKAYLRYEHTSQFGVTASSSCNICFSEDAKLVYSGALENVNAWNLRQGTLAATLKQGLTDTGAAAPEATRLAHSPTSAHVAVGYADGSIRIWNTAEAECLVVLSGHSSAISALAYSRDGSSLASGSQDTDIILWDTLGETGLCKLRAHTDQVTDLFFLDAHNMLVSGSKDGAVRVWDLATRHCCQYIPIHVGEVWAMAVDPAQERVAVGSTDAEVRMFSVAPPGGDSHASSNGARHSREDSHARQQPASASDEGGSGSRAKVLAPIGSLKRESAQRTAQLAFSSNGAFLAASSTGKLLQVWHKRAPQEIAKKQKRRKKRQKEKTSKGGEDGADAAADAGLGADGGDGGGSAALDEWAPQTVYRAAVALRSFAFAPHVTKHTVLCQIALGLANNSIALVNVLPEDNEVVLRIEGQGNSSDVRALALSEDDQRLLTTGRGGSKLWNAATGVCTNTIDSGYGLCCLFAPGGRFAAVGTKDGKLELLNIGAAEVVERLDAHASQIWSIAALPKGTGFVTGSADKTLKFWHWASTTGDDQPQRLSLKLATSVNTGQDVLCVRVSPDGSLVAASLISNVIKVFYLDTMKWFIDLYGHKLPALTLDISSDNTLLVSGSADKNIKIWGLDFGDCHKSLFAHQDSVMSVAFVPKTHYVFTVGKDKMLKYWDADKFELLLELPAHHAEVWCLAVSRAGDFVISGSHDRSLRRWERTDEPFFVDEEKERRLESLFEGAAGGERRTQLPEGAVEEGVVEAASHKTRESVEAVDKIIEALDMAVAETARLEEAGAGASIKPNPFLLGLSPSAYVQRSLSDVRANDLETTLIMLPFPDALKLLSYLSSWLDDATQVKLRSRIQGLKNVMGFNMAALRHLQQRVREEHFVHQADAILPAKRTLAEAGL